ncbi:MAG: hypothetical protein OEV55_01525 [candidate division Zixibacteria bacterium]|nr:hypothetical protein [candidate division Zixibacteria bacterium]
MKITMVIPSYWARESKVGWKKGDAIYDHPTPLDKEGTLLGTIKSMEILKDKDFQLVIIAVPTAEEIGKEVENNCKKIIDSTSIGVDILLFGSSHQKEIHDFFLREGKDEYADLVKLHGYSNIRNLCTFISHVLGSDVAVLIDDDEIFEDPDFMTKAREFIGREINEKKVYAVAGYYLQADGDYHVKREFKPWMKHWDQYERMNQAFDKIIGADPRLKQTSFVFGGNMAIHRNLFTRIPFDPYVPRGEDIDFLINAKMFGFSFFLDNQLAIKHLAPPKTHPVWMRLREDIYRFVYERAKIQSQKEVEGMTKVHAEEFDPYPGCFLKDDLEEKIEKACKSLSEEYLLLGDKNGSQEALRNIQISKTDAVPNFDPFEKLCQLQKRWKEMMEYTSQEEISSKLKKIVEGR